VEFNISLFFHPIAEGGGTSLIQIN